MKRFWQLKILFVLVGISTLSFIISETSAQSEKWWSKWRRQNDQGNRYEGRVPIPVGGSNVELLSFFGCREPFDNSVNLKVRFFLATDAKVLIRGREVQESKQYRMESKIEENSKWIADRWNEFGPWETRKVLDKEQIPYRNLGVVITLDKATRYDRLLAPAFIYHSELPQWASEYTMHLCSKYTLGTLSYTLMRRLDDKDVPLTTPFHLFGTMIGGEPFPVVVPVREISEGWTLLVIDGKYKSRMGGIHREYLFYHRPQIR